MLSFCLSGYKITYDLSIDIVTSVRMLTVTFNDLTKGPSLHNNGDQIDDFTLFNSYFNE